MKILEDNSLVHIFSLFLLFKRRTEEMGYLNPGFYKQKSLVFIRLLRTT